MPVGFSWGQTKPPPGATINWGHQLAAGLKALVLFNEGAGLPRDLVRGKLLTPGGSPTWARERLGTAGAAATTSDYWILGPSTDYASLTSASVLLIRRKTDATNRDSSAFGCNDTGGVDRLGGHHPFSDGVIYWDFGGSSGSNRVTWNGWTNTGIDRFAFVGGKRGLALYHNGILRASSTTAVTRIASASNFVINRGNGATADVQDILFFALYDRELTAAEVALWNADPYAMITPPVWARSPVQAAAAAAARAFRALLGVGV